MLVDALLAVFGFWLVYQGSYFLRMQYNPEPIVIAPVVGLLLGDLETGLIMGASLEAIFMGVMVVGGERPSDPAIAATVSTYFAIRTNIDIEAAVALAYPVAILGNSFNTLIRGLTYILVPWMQNIVIKERNMKKYEIVSLLMMNFYSFAAKYIAAFLVIALGSSAIDMISNQIPVWLLTGLSASGKALCAIGMGITLSMLWDKELLGFFFIGFLLLQALGMSLIQIAMLGTAVAVIYLFIILKINKTPTAKTNEVVEGDDFDL